MNRNVVVRELGPSLLGDYFGFFDGIYETDPWLSSRDNPWWSSCYCGFFDDARPEKELNSLGSKELKRLRTERIVSGRAKGFLAYIGDKVVGWCNADHRADYVSFQHLAEAIEDPTEPVGSILCFVVAHQHRRMGVATSLLESACASFKRSGLLYAEGVPKN